MSGFWAAGRPPSSSPASLQMNIWARNAACGGPCGCRLPGRRSVADPGRCGLSIGNAMWPGRSTVTPVMCCSAARQEELGGLARVAGDHREAIAFGGFLHRVLRVLLSRTLDNGKRALSHRRRGTLLLSAYLFPKR